MDLGWCSARGGRPGPARPQANTGNGGGSGSQSNVNGSTTIVGNRGQSAGLIAGPIVAPVTAGAQTNASGPINLNPLGNQRGAIPPATTPV